MKSLHSSQVRILKMEEVSIAFELKGLVNKIEQLKEHDLGEQIDLDQILTSLIKGP